MSVLSLQMAELTGEKFLRKLGVDSIKAARALSANEIQKVESATELQNAAGSADLQDPLAGNRNVLILAGGRW